MHKSPPLSFAGTFDFGPFIKLLEKGERGAIMAHTLRGWFDDEGGVSVERISPLETPAGMTAVLFFDRFEYPEPALSMNVGFDKMSHFGESGKLQVRPVAARGGRCDLAELAFEDWLEHEKIEPAGWSIWHGPNFDPIPASATAPGLAFKLRLQDSLIVPHPETDLYQVIAFKQRRRDELRAFRHHMETMCAKVASSGHDPHVFQIEAEKFEQALADYLKVAKEANWRKILARLDLKMDWGEAIRAGLEKAPAASALTGAGLGASFDVATAIIGAGLAGISVVSAAGLKKQTEKPFAYMAAAIKELS